MDEAPYAAVHTEPLPTPDDEQERADGFRLIEELGSEAVLVIQRFLRSCFQRRVYAMLKDVVCRAERSTTSDVLLKINPAESHVARDPLMRGRVRFRLAGEHFPPRVVYKLYSVGVRTQYLSGDTVFAPGSAGAAAARVAMGRAKALRVEQTYRARVPDPRRPLDLSEAVQAQSRADARARALGGRGNDWRDIFDPDTSYHTGFAGFVAGSVGKATPEDVAQMRRLKRACALSASRGPAPALGGAAAAEAAAEDEEERSRERAVVFSALAATAPAPAAASSGPGQSRRRRRPRTVHRPAAGSFGPRWASSMPSQFAALRRKQERALSRPLPLDRLAERMNAGTAPSPSLSPGVRLPAVAGSSTAPEGALRRAASEQELDESSPSPPRGQPQPARPTTSTSPLNRKWRMLQRQRAHKHVALRLQLRDRERQQEDDRREQLRRRAEELRAKHEHAASFYGWSRPSTQSQLDTLDADQLLRLQSVGDAPTAPQVSVPPPQSMPPPVLDLNWRPPHGLPSPMGKPDESPQGWPAASAEKLDQSGQSARSATAKEVDELLDWTRTLPDSPMSGV